MVRPWTLTARDSQDRPQTSCPHLAKGLPLPPTFYTISGSALSVGGGPELCPFCSPGGRSWPCAVHSTRPGPLRTEPSVRLCSARSACCPRLRVSATWSPATPPTSNFVRQSPTVWHSQQTLKGQPSRFNASFPLAQETAIRHFESHCGFRPSPRLFCHCLPFPGQSLAPTFTLKAEPPRGTQAI